MISGMIVRLFVKIFKNIFGSGFEQSHLKTPLEEKIQRG